MEVSYQHHAPAASPPRKNLNTDWRPGRPLSRSWNFGEISVLLTGFMKMVRNDIPPCSMHNSQLFGTGLQPDWHNVALSSKCLTRECFLLTDFRLIWYSVRLRGDAHAPSQHSSVLCRGDVVNILRRATCLCVSWTVQCCCWHRSIHKACLITCRFLTMSYHT